jgi:hypothetical protein
VQWSRTQAFRCHITHPKIVAPYCLNSEKDNELLGLTDR